MQEENGRSPGVPRTRATDAFTAVVEFERVEIKMFEFQRVKLLVRPVCELFAGHIRVGRGAVDRRWGFD